jgi:hypothetical protein
VDEWLPEKHLASFVVDVFEGLDLRAMSGSYRGFGSASFHESRKRKQDRACPVGLRAVRGNRQPLQTVTLLGTGQRRFA